METRNLLSETHNETSAQQSSYEIDLKTIKKNKILGRGKYGVVYAGIWNNKPVAIKEMKTSKDGSTKDEINIMQTLAELQAPNVVQFMGFSADDIKTYIVMEHMSGGDLEGYIDEYSKPKWSMRQALMKDITMALVFLHDRKIVHRDIKPANVLLDDKLHAKLTDFGFSKYIDDKIEYSGTPVYCAPEIMEEKMPHREKSDIFSLAMTFFAIENWDNDFYPPHFTFNRVVEFLKGGKRLDIDDYRYSPVAGLIKACWQQDPDDRLDTNEVQYILQNVEHIDYYEALKKAVKNDNEHTVSAILKKHPSLTKVFDSDGQLLIHIAAKWGSINTLKVLVSLGCYLTSYSTDKISPLQFAASYNQLTALQFIVTTIHEQTKDTIKEIINETRDGWTALHWASLKGHVDILTYLLAYGANPNTYICTPCKINHDKTPLYFAAERGHNHLIPQLLRAGAHVAMACGKLKRLPIHVAAEQGHLAVVSLLLEKDPTALSKKDAQDRTPLYLAAVNGHNSVVKLFLKQGAIECLATDKTLKLDQHTREWLSLIEKVRFHFPALDLPTLYAANAYQESNIIDVLKQLDELSNYLKNQLKRLPQSTKKTKLTAELTALSECNTSDDIKQLVGDIKEITYRRRGLLKFKWLKKPTSYKEFKETISFRP